MSEKTIGDNSKVTMHFALKLEDGEEVDSIFGGEPATFVMGDGSLLPGFELPLRGLKAGDHETFTIPPEQSFGNPNPVNIQKLERRHFPENEELSVGLMMTFGDAAGNEVPGMVRSFDDAWVTVDFNHPLSGRTLLFEAHILGVE